MIPTQLAIDRIVPARKGQVRQVPGYEKFLIGDRADNHYWNIYSLRGELDLMADRFIVNYSKVISEG